ncbi:MAG: hypothetical protein LBF01_01545 [Bacteroidales bacterium]|jgi:hypothetical protein|nr:hypothetical protein [Bacteroidales bacterium]
MTANERVKKVLNQLKTDGFFKNIREVSKILNYHEGTLSNIIVGKYPVSPKVIKAIVATYPQISEKWLKTGEGEMFTSEKIKDRFFKYVKYRGINEEKFDKITGKTKAEIVINKMAKTSFLTLWRKENKDFTQYTVKYVLKHFSDLNPVWLTTGKGEMIIDESENIENKVNEEMKMLAQRTGIKQSTNHKLSKTKKKA